MMSHSIHQIAKSQGQWSLAEGSYRPNTAWSLLRKADHRFKLRDPDGNKLCGLHRL